MPVTTSSTRSPSPAGRRRRRSPTASSPTSSPTAPGGSTTPASSSGRRASSASTPARPSGAPAPTWHAIAAVTRAPVRTLVNTHHHGDHTFGNCLFPGATIVGHERAREEAIAFGPPRELPFWDHGEWGDLTLDPPFLTFTDSVTVHVGDLRAELRHVGDRRAHDQRRDRLAAGALGALLRRPRVQRRHAVPAHGLGRRGDRGAGERRGAAGRARRSCPGTGRCSPATQPIRATLDYLRFVLDVAERGAAGRGQPARRRPRHRPRPVRRLARRRAHRRQPVPRVRRAGRHPARRPRSTSSPRSADMVAYNGGRPLTCLA